MGAGFLYYHYLIYTVYRGVALMSVVIAMYVGAYTDAASPVWTFIPMFIAIILFAAVLWVNGVNSFRSGRLSAAVYKNYVVYFNVAAVIFATVVTVDMLSVFQLDRLYSAGISVSIALAGAVQMALGMRRHSRLLRVIAICTLGVVIVKLGIYDLWRMAPEGRIVVFILLGVILLSVSFFYQRLRGVLLDKDADR